MGMSVGNKPAGEAMAEINVVPLVDVMLVLLIIFMITAPLMTHRVKVDLPKADAARNEQPAGTITIALQTTGALYMNDQPISQDQLLARLRVEARRQPQPAVHLRGDRTTQYKDVMKVMAVAKAAGMKQVGLVTSPAAAR
jgi:biopolymer transport protein ExbD